MTLPRQDFASPFSAVGYEDWLQLVEPVIGRSTFEKKLTTSTPDELTILPLYDRASYATDGDPSGFPGAAPFVRGANNASGPWDIRQRHDLIDARSATKSMLADLEQGATSILLRLHHPPAENELAEALDGVYLDMAPIALDAGPWGLDAAATLNAVWDQRSIPEALRLASLRLDPVGVFARFGRTYAVDGMVEAARRFAATPHVHAVAVDATPYADAGASDALELACSLATGAAYLRSMVAGGLELDDAVAQIEFTYTARADQFATISKLRAARLCWNRIVEASGGTPAGQLQHAISAASMYTRTDPWVNLLRTMTSTFAAAVGGAQSITALPFDTAIGQSQELSRRTARNLQLLLQGESHVAKVIDPAGGSWFVEQYTSEMAAQAWKLFQEIEQAGGIDAELLDGSLQERIDAQWSERERRVATRRDAITGVSEFADTVPDPLERQPWPSLDGIVTNELIRPLPLRRDAAPFDTLREAAASSALKPVVFLANLGPVATHTARATFATNFFAAGGIGVLTNDGFDDADSAAVVFRASGAPVAVICSSDDMYAEWGTHTAEALKATGCKRVYLAGNPGDRRAEYETAGVDEFIAIGSDVVATLTSLHELLGVA